MNIDFNTIKKNIKNDYSGFKLLKVAILGDSATQIFAKALRGYAFESMLNVDIFDSDYDQIDREIFDNTSELYKFDPDFVVIFQCTQKLKQRFYKLSKNDISDFAQNHLEFVERASATIVSGLRAKIIYFNFNELDDREFGNYSNKTDKSFLYQLRKINYELMNLSQKIKNLFICDISYLVTQVGDNEAIDEKFYINADIIFKPDFYATIAKNVLDIINATIGRFKKCLILDLDNTIWGGIIGDDGIEKIQLGDYKIGKAFMELQSFAKHLKERGIILAVCSKNTESIAKEPFEKHPDMVLRLNDIALFVANWENKVDNIRYIKDVFDIGFDSMVFLDDNPFERSMVKAHIPEITVPDLPEDPSLFLNYLRRENLFETSSFSEADEDRTKQYQIEADRKSYKKSFANEEDFLKGLGMECAIAPFTSFTIPRISQLTQRSNQFNLRTIRYTEDDIQRISLSENYFTLSFNLKDKFSDYGLISAIIMEKRENNRSLFIDTWIMSCRVLKRNVEKFVLNEIVRIAKENKLQQIVGEYIPTLKNEIVKDMYDQFGFVFKAGVWRMNVAEYQSEETFIKKNDDYGRNN